VQGFVDLGQPGMFPIQLKATGATAEDLAKFPARLSREGSKHLPKLHMPYDICAFGIQSIKNVDTFV
jgi:hypothetical protein